MGHADHATKEWTVTLADGDEQVTEDLLAITRHAAAAAGELMHPGYRAVSVAFTWPVTGRCSSCRSIIFSDERARGIPGRSVVCADC